MSTLQTVVNEILDTGSSISSECSMLTAITGIDASGRGYFTERLVDALQTRGVCAVAINVDAWLNLPNVRFDASNPAELVRSDDTTATGPPPAHRNKLRR